jgi:tricorn protease
MSRCCWAMAVALLCVAASIAESQSRGATPEDLYQQALTRERSAGDIQGAIQLYRQVAASSDRVLAARALIRLGEAYEKLGAKESQAAYERVLREFADQTEPVNVARTRLAALRGTATATRAAAAPVSSAMVFADLPALRPRDAAQFDFSPSGEEIVFRRSAADTDSLAGSALEVATSSGTVVRTLLPAEREMGRSNPRWSPDGRYIAYLQRSFVGADTAFAAVMLVPAAGGAPRVITTDIGSARPAQGGLLWTPDSRAVSFWTGGRLLTYDLQGTLVRTVALQVRHQGQITSYSPDGRWLIYHAINVGSEQDDDVDVWVMPAEGGEPIQLTTAPGYDAWPAWSPDGRAIFFVSDRSGDRNVWKLEIDPRTGSARGDPVQITSYTDATVLHPRVIDGGARITFALVRNMTAVHAASTETPRDGRVVARGGFPQLSPDGRTIYYTGEGVSPRGIFAVSVEGGPPRRLTSTTPGGPFSRPFSLSRDGRAIAYFSRAGAQNVLFVVPAAGGQPREILRFESREHLVPAWSPDGAHIAFVRGEGVYVIGADGRGERQVAQLRGWDGWSVRWSPGGEYIAAFGWPAAAAGGEQNAAYVVPAAGGELRRVTPSTEPGYKEGLEWHPDGRRLTYMYYGHDGRGDETRVAYLDGRPTTRLLDQPYPQWDYVGVWEPQGRSYYFISSTRGTWGLYALDEGADEARVVWLQNAVSPGAGIPSFSGDGRSMVWPVQRTTRQLWSLDLPR